MAKRKTLADIPQLLNITPLALGDYTRWEKCPADWRATPKEDQLKWLDENHPDWLWSHDDGHPGHTLVRFPLLDDTDSRHPQLQKGLDGFERDKREALRIRIQKLGENLDALGINVPQGMHAAVLNLPETKKMIREQAEREVDAMFADAIRRKDQACRQLGELKELRIQGLLKPLQPVLRGLVRSMVYDKSLPSSEELSAFEELVETFKPLAVGLDAVQNLLDHPKEGDSFTLEAVRERFKVTLYPHTP